MAHGLRGKNILSLLTLKLQFMNNLFIIIKSIFKRKINLNDNGVKFLLEGLCQMNSLNSLKLQLAYYFSSKNILKIF